jgi:hypothetical protein
LKSDSDPLKNLWRNYDDYQPSKKRHALDIEKNYSSLHPF